MFSTIKKERETKIGGIIYHTIQWITSPTGDLIYTNPHYKSTSASQTNMNHSASIYCIHGIADHVSAFEDLVENMAPMLPENLSTINVVSFGQMTLNESIENLANMLAEKINNNGDKNVILIGHSRGGLIASYYAEYLAKHYKVNVPSVFTISSPFGGAKSAQLPLSLYCKSVREMEIGSDFLQALNKKTAHSNVRYICYASKKDGLVTVDASFPESTMKDVCIYDEANHISILHTDAFLKSISQAVIDIANKFNRGEIPVGRDKFPIGIHDLCDDIDIEVARLKASPHIKSSTGKQKILLMLKQKLLESVNTDVSCYPEAGTISQFISKFLYDQNIIPGSTPNQILSEHLNYPASLVSAPESKTVAQKFIEIAIKRYQDIEINNHVTNFKCNI